MSFTSSAVEMCRVSVAWRGSVFIQPLGHRQRGGRVHGGVAVAALLPLSALLPIGDPAMESLFAIKHTFSMEPLMQAPHHGQLGPLGRKVPARCRPPPALLILLAIGARLEGLQVK